MKKMMITAAAALLLWGCAQETPGSDTKPPVTDDLYGQYTSAVSDRLSSDSDTAAVSTRYTYLFVDDTTGVYQMDGVLETDGSLMHMTQHLNANGMASEIEGWYDGSRLYNTFNGIHYYEDMTAKDVRDSMLMPLEPYAFPQDYLQGLSAATAENGDVTYSLAIAEDRLADVFKDRYDFNSMDELDNVKVKSGIITDTFSSEGYFLNEKAKFEVTFEYSGQEVKTTYEGSVNYMNRENTDVAITDQMQKDFAAYVNYADIDTSTIDVEPASDDKPEATAEATFRKRLVNRLGYTEESEGVYTQKYNENESYTIDFNNRTFMYSNYSISYVYNWSGNVGSMGKCTVDFASATSSSECTDETKEMIAKVKDFMRMELYYCGLSLEDLQAEQ